MLASTNPAARIYDPAFAYELAIVVEEALSRIIGPDPEDRFFYITLYNENYPMPALPEGTEGDAVRAGVLRGLYRFRAADESHQRRATIVFSGPMWQAAEEARSLLAEHWGVGCDTWSATSWSALRHEAIAVERANRLHPHADRREPFVTAELGSTDWPVVAVTDYMRAVPDQIAALDPAAVRLARHRWLRPLRRPPRPPPLLRGGRRARGGRRLVGAVRAGQGRPRRGGRRDRTLRDRSRRRRALPHLRWGNAGGRSSSISRVNPPSARLRRAWRCP